MPRGPEQTLWSQSRVLTQMCATHCHASVLFTAPMQASMLRCSYGKTKHSLELHSHLSWLVNPEQCPLKRKDSSGVESMLAVQGGCCYMAVPRLASGIHSLRLWSVLKDAALNFEQSGLRVFSSSFLEGQERQNCIFCLCFTSSPSRNYATLGLVWSSVNFSELVRIAFYPTV